MGVREREIIRNCKKETIYMAGVFSLKRIVISFARSREQLIRNQNYAGIPNFSDIDFQTVQLVSTRHLLSTFLSSGIEMKLAY